MKWRGMVVSWVEKGTASQGGKPYGVAGNISIRALKATGLANNVGNDKAFMPGMDSAEAGGFLCPFAY